MRFVKCGAVMRAVLVSLALLVCVSDPANSQQSPLHNPGITQLTGDVTAGPGGGSVPVTVNSYNGGSTFSAPNGIGPSGDTTGVADTATVQAILNTGKTPSLLPGDWYFGTNGGPGVTLPNGTGIQGYSSLGYNSSGYAPASFTAPQQKIHAVSGMVGPVLVVNSHQQAAFTATISNGSGGAGTILNVSAVASGKLTVGALVTVAGGTNTTITALGTGTGGSGTYTVDVSQNITSEAMTADGVRGTGTNGTSIKIVGVTIICSGTPSGVDGIGSGSYLATIKDVSVKGCDVGFGDATSTDYSNQADVENSQFTNNNYGIMRIIDTRGANIGTSGNILDGVFFGGTGNYLVNLRSEWNQRFGVNYFSTSGSNNNTLVGGQVEQNFSVGLNFQNSSVGACDHKVSGLILNENGQTNTSGNDAQFSVINCNHGPDLDVTTISGVVSGVNIPAHVGRFSGTNGGTQGPRIAGLLDGYVSSRWAGSVPAGQYSAPDCGLGVGRDCPGTGNIDVSGQYKVAGSQIACANLAVSAGGCSIEPNVIFQNVAGSYNYTPTTGMTQVLVEAIGAGGPGGRGIVAASASGGAGGGGGACVKRWYKISDLTAIASPIPYVVGAGQTSHGTAGGATIFGSGANIFIKAQGGGFGADGQSAAASGGGGGAGLGFAPANGSAATAGSSSPGGGAGGSAANGGGGLNGGGGGAGGANGAQGFSGGSANCGGAGAGSGGGASSGVSTNGGSGGQNEANLGAATGGTSGSHDGGTPPTIPLSYMPGEGGAGGWGNGAGSGAAGNGSAGAGCGGAGGGAGSAFTGGTGGTEGAGQPGCIRITEFP